MENSTTTTQAPSDIEANQVRNISKDEVSAHAKDGDCWVIIEGKVYDVSVYMAKHPGGADILLENSNGKDASQAYEDADHTRRARELVKKYYIGELTE
eukprot:403375067